MFIPELKTATPQADGQSDLRHLFAYDRRGRSMLQFTQAVMRAPDAVTGERELLAAMTSREIAPLLNRVARGGRRAVPRPR
jgi:hypothetical protein